jgi:hypothetical protein
MQIYTMRLYWVIGESCPSDPGIISLSSAELRLAVEEAEDIWSDFKDKLLPSPHGYLVYQQPSGKIIHERTMENPTPVSETPTKPRRPRRLPWLWSRSR